LFFKTTDELIDLCRYYLENNDKYNEKKQNYYNSFIKHPYECPLTVFTDYKQLKTNKTYISTVDYKKAPTYVDDKNNYVLKLSKTDDLTNLPFVSIVTITYNRSVFLPLMMYNWNNFNYPRDKLEWIIIDDSTTNNLKQQFSVIEKNNSIHYYYYENRLTIGEKRNIGIQKANYDYIVHMDDDDLYQEFSIYSKIKLLMDNPDIGCIGCNDYGVYDIIKNNSYLLTTPYISEASMCFRKKFWEELKFEEKDHLMGEGYLFTINRKKSIMIIPFEFNFIAITHKSNITGKLRKSDTTSSNKLYNELTLSQKQILSQLYKKLKIN
jgi:glycosyltransferase involved in cell wall biosynthesis